MPVDHDHDLQDYCSESCPAHPPSQIAPTLDGGDAANPDDTQRPRPVWIGDPWVSQRNRAAAATENRPATSQPPPGADPGLAELQAEGERRSRLAGELEEWWYARVQTEIEGAIPKAIEYSSTDLVDLGRQIAQLAGWDEFTDAHCAELGIAFYVAGKVARIMGAVKDGRLPSDDTWHDIAVYTKMAQRVRDVGSWPGV